MKTKNWSLLFAFLLLSPVNSMADNGEKLFLECLSNGVVKLSSEVLSENDKLARPNGSIFEEININSLIKYRKPDDRSGDVALRVGSNVITKSCGSLQIKISAGYYNSNPQGHMGGENNFPIVSVVSGTTPIITNYNIGFCSIRSSLVGSACPENWAESITLTPGNEVGVTVTKHYDEFKQISTEDASQGN